MTVETPKIRTASFELPGHAIEWQQRALEYCAENFRQTALDVRDKILESDYLYGVDAVDYRLANNNDSKRENVWTIYERVGNGEAKSVYLTESGQLRYDIVMRPYWENGVRCRSYQPGEYGESPMETIAIYANLVGIVEEDDFREKHLAFLEC